MRMEHGEGEVGECGGYSNGINIWLSTWLAKALTVFDSINDELKV